MEDLKKADGEHQSLLAASNDSALSADERDKKKQAADLKFKQIQESKAALDQYDRSAKQNLASQLQRVHDKILGEIRDAVQSKGKAGGYTMVIDSSAETVTQTPMVVYNNGQVDITDDVLKQLNAGAPIDFNTKVPPVSPSLLGTNRP